jgi:hypothetical protein
MSTRSTPAAAKRRRIVADARSPSAIASSSTSKPSRGMRKYGSLSPSGGPIDHSSPIWVGSVVAAPAVAPKASYGCPICPGAAGFVTDARPYAGTARWRRRSSRAGHAGRTGHCTVARGGRFAHCRCETLGSQPGGFDRALAAVIGSVACATFGPRRGGPPAVQQVFGARIRRRARRQLRAGARGKKTSSVPNRLETEIGGEPPEVERAPGPAAKRAWDGQRAPSSSGALAATATAARAGSPASRIDSGSSAGASAGDTSRRVGRRYFPRRAEGNASDP